MDTGDLEAIVDAAIAEHPDDWAKFCDGEDKVMGFFVGQVMKATQGNADGKVVSSLLREKRPGDDGPPTPDRRCCPRPGRGRVWRKRRQAFCRPPARGSLT